ncbi:NADH dehydrogenase [ubiquinone] 1 alpha subcomplex assembly factor 2 isoform X1 [Elephas maximus indicus]|uniref:NADH dehydrogenase [ubiquinone] 1 alpha subcomplex assembly factor 2 isoform X1 n=1 Tax=Elephas maximus indicus TaxID=99487 RepID=UPI0021169474|nr:NADH dehydrogenase [ubiquinone] 1 alpha subcomplex assembly factor 2 isoform X1 [Elephas maximus indicus]
MGWSQRLFRSLWRVLSKEVKQHVGTDQLGNKYYYIPEYKNWRGQTIREKRIVEAAQKKEVDYETGDIPAEWEAWIRRMRKIPPTMEYPCLCWKTAPGVPPQRPATCFQVLIMGRTSLRFSPGSATKEILKNEKYREEMKIKGQDIYEKEKLLCKEELLAPPAQTQIKGHASAPYFGKEEPSEDPSSTAKTFQPGSWMPHGKSQNK